MSDHQANNLSTSVAEIPDKGQAQFLVDHLYKTALQAKPDLRIELRTIWPKERALGKGNKTAISHIFPVSEFPDYFKRAIKANRQGYGIYIGINPRPASGEKEQDAIRDIVCLWADVDAKNFLAGKKEALKRLSEFLIEPSLIVDSGNGYHAYWTLEEPIIDRTEEETAAVKQTLVGLAEALGGDVQVRNIDRIFRLPGTLNTKKENELKPARIVQAKPEKRYSLGDFEDYRDPKFKEPSPTSSLDAAELQGTTVTISKKDEPAAREDIKKLKISPKTKQRILTGETYAAPEGDGSRSGRDFRIICGLVGKDYSYQTVHDIFFNEFLACSNRILPSPELRANLSEMDKAEKILLYDFSKAVEYIKKQRAVETPQIRAIRTIKAIPSAELPAEEKLRRIQKYIVSDLFETAGKGFKNAGTARKFFFVTKEKILLDIGGAHNRQNEGGDFRCFLRARYDLPEKDMVEVLAAVETQIWATGAEIEPFNFARYDDQAGILYISNHDNSVFKLDGKSIQVVDNGTDNVIFEFHSEYLPVRMTPPIEGIDYFAGGFNWDLCRRESLLAKHIIEKTSFAPEEKHNLQPEEQRYLFALYFYSLFFESILEEKPIVCWTGVKASGKSLISTAVGKVLFGPNFLPAQLSDDINDFQVALIENYYLVLDNVDSRVQPPVIDALCATATGARISKRKLYTDSVEFKVKARIFLSLTSRDPKFKRDDLVDRLIIFNTAKIKKVESRTFLFKGILEARPALWAEILTNLNSIVGMLKEKRNQRCLGVFRMADWELWAEKASNLAGQASLGIVLDKMNREKAHFGIEDSPIYRLLHQICFDDGQKIENRTTSQLFSELMDKRDKDFEMHCKSPVSLGKFLNNNLDEFKNEFNISLFEQRNRTIEYSISAKKEEGFTGIEIIQKNESAEDAEDRLPFST